MTAAASPEPGGLPIGLQLVGKMHQDGHLLEIASAFERLTR